MDGDIEMTKRTLVLAALAVLAAMPLLWLSIDATAGEKLLKLTSTSASSQVIHR